MFGSKPSSSPEHKSDKLLPCRSEVQLGLGAAQRSEDQLLLDPYDQQLAKQQNYQNEFDIYEENQGDQGHMMDDGQMSTTSVMAKQIIFATQMTNAKSDYFLRGDPVSLIITNIPSFKGGRANPWMESDDLIALRDAR